MIIFGLITPRCTSINKHLLKWMNMYRWASIDIIIPFIGLMVFTLISLIKIKMKFYLWYLETYIYHLWQIDMPNIRLFILEKKPYNILITEIQRPSFPSTIIRVIYFIICYKKKHWLLNRINLEICHIKFQPLLNQQTRRVRSSSSSGRYQIPILFPLGEQIVYDHTKGG